MQGDGKRGLILAGAAHRDPLIAVPLTPILEGASGDGVRVVALRHLFYCLIVLHLFYSRLLAVELSVR